MLHSNPRKAFTTSEFYKLLGHIKYSRKQPEPEMNTLQKFIKNRGKNVPLHVGFNDSRINSQTKSEMSFVLQFESKEYFSSRVNRVSIVTKFLVMSL